MIDAVGLGFSYPDGREALREITFSVDSTESIGIIGANGAGKTTLMLCLCGVLRPTAGHLAVAGIDVLDSRCRSKLPAHIGVVFQNSDDQLFCSTVGEDVAFGPLNLGINEIEVRQRVSDSLNKVGMSGGEGRAPFRLSGGEKRRAAIAGILAMKPEIMLLDEPSMFLDPRGRKELVQLTNQLPGTRLIASHDMVFIRETCNRVIALESGRIVADGATEILENKDFMGRIGLDWM